MMVFTCKNCEEGEFLKVFGIRYKEAFALKADAACAIDRVAELAATVLDFSENDKLVGKRTKDVATAEEYVGALASSASAAYVSIMPGMGVLHDEEVRILRSREECEGPCKKVGIAVRILGGDAAQTMQLHA